MSFGSEILLKVGVVLAFALNGAVIFTLMDVKASAWMQRRPGPLHVGLRGLIFPLAEVIKFIQKEDIIPTKVDKTIFKLAPAFVLFSVFGLFVVVPISPTLVVVDLNLGVFYLLAISTLSTLGVLVAGWSSANKYSLLGFNSIFLNNSSPINKLKGPFPPLTLNLKLPSFLSHEILFIIVS